METRIQNFRTNGLLLFKNSMGLRRERMGWTWRKKGRIWYVKAGNLRKRCERPTWKRGWTGRLGSVGRMDLEPRQPAHGKEVGQGGWGAWGEWTWSPGSLHGAAPGLRVGGSETWPASVAGALGGPSVASY